MGDNNLSSGVDGNVIPASIVNQYKTALSGDMVPRATDGTPNDRVSNLGSDTNRIKDIHSHGVQYNKGVKLLPAGMMMPFAGSTAPTDWLFCNGDTIGNADSGATHAGAEYEDLFEVLKATWGNAGTEVFDDDDTVLIPDLSDGRFLRNTGGQAPTLGVNQSSQNKAHTHGQNGLDSAGAVGNSIQETGGTAGYSHVTGGNGGSPYSQISTDSDGGVETRPDNVAVNYLIRI